MGKFGFGLGFDLYPHDMGIPEIVRMSKNAEKLGFQYIWLGQEALYRDVFQTLAMIAIATETIQLGPSVVNPYTMHPAVAAAATATLDEISHGRAIHGIAAGGSSVLGILGIPRWSRPLSYIRDAVVIARHLLDGEKLNYKGKVFETHNAYLAQPPKDHYIPILLGARAKGTLKIAGELADGVNLGASPIGFIPDVLEMLKPGLAISKRKIEDLILHNPMNFSIAKESEDAFNAVLADPALRHNFLVQICDINPIALSRCGIPKDTADHLRETLAREGEEAAQQLITRELAEPFVIAGDPEECIKKIRRYKEYGIDIISIFQPYGPDENEAIRLVGEEVIPAFKE
ncbi:MAG: LLM class flavin-dependent oxidoreductase [Candidatus Ranarchaeia archaeon]